jgi:pyruvate kinase
MNGFAKLDRVVDALDSLEALASSFEARCADALAQVHPRHVDGARNLLHYLALRQTDLRDLQFVLAEHGLSSLAGADAHVLTTIRGARRAACALLDRDVPALEPAIGVGEAHARIRASADRLFGPRKRAGHVRIMVTMPIEAADDGPLVLDMVRAGMECARINCSTGGPREWARTAEHVRHAAAETGRGCRIFMDLCGPKIRTGELVAGPRVVVLTPSLDGRGRVIAPAAIEFVPDGGPDVRATAGADAQPTRIPLPATLFRRLAPGCTLEFEDARGRLASLEVTSVESGRVRARTWSRVFVEACLPARVRDVEGKVLAEDRIGSLPEVRAGIPLRPGDTLIVHADPRPGEQACSAEADETHPAHVACCQPGVLERVAVGDPFVLDDGDFRGVVREVGGGEIVVEITHVAEEGSQLHARKGINLPDTDVGLYGLTEKDLEDLPHVLEHADAVNVSFVNRPEDVDQVFDVLDRAGAGDLPVVFKIETRMGLERLPSILLSAMRRPDVGIMLARGDLAAEIGWIAMARAQEDILSLCEAAHVPVIWATQVLTQLSRRGVPTRAEISDVVLAERAECVMLNKGRHIVDAIRMLDEILDSIGPCQIKKRSLLPPLSLELPSAATGELSRR